MDLDHHTMSQDQVTPRLRVQAPTSTFSTMPSMQGHPADDTCSTLRSNFSSSSSLSVAAADPALLGTVRVLDGEDGYVSAYNMLTGIRTAVSMASAKPLPKEPLAPRYFVEDPELSFDDSPLAGTHGTARCPFKFKDYAPHVFRAIRERVFGLDPADYLMSLAGKYIVSEITSPGKSGAFFYYSRDYRFIIKTIHHSEHRRLRIILRDYYDHLRAHPNTLISRYLGLHRVTLPFGRRIYFVVMNNVFPALHEIHSRYDLKGSTYGRTAGPDAKPTACFKDLDWLAQNQKLELGPEKRRRFLDQLQKDVLLLQRCGVMDYSLLIGVHDLNRGNEHSTINLCEFSEGASSPGSPGKSPHLQPNSALSPRKETLVEFGLADSTREPFEFYKDQGGYQSTDENDLPNPLIYFMGVIDFLTYYSTRKRLETKGKGVIHYKDKHGLSAIPAHAYGERFYGFISAQIGPQMEPHTGPGGATAPAREGGRHGANSASANTM